jgi:hypothetical protein
MSAPALDLDGKEAPVAPGKSALQALYRFGADAVQKHLLSHLSADSAALLALVSRSTAAVARLWWDSGHFRLTLLRIAVRHISAHLALFPVWGVESALQTGSGRSEDLKKFRQKSARVHRALCEKRGRSRRALPQYLARCAQGAHAVLKVAASAGFPPKQAPFKSLEQIASSRTASAKALIFARSLWIGRASWLERLCVSWLAQPAITALYALEPCKALAEVAGKMGSPSGKALCALSSGLFALPLTARDDPAKDLVSRIRCTSDGLSRDLVHLVCAEARDEGEVLFALACCTLKSAFNTSDPQVASPWARLCLAAEWLAEEASTLGFDGWEEGGAMPQILEVIRFWLTPAVSWLDEPKDRVMWVYIREGRAVEKYFRRLTTLTYHQLAMCIPEPDPFGLRGALLAFGSGRLLGAKEALEVLRVCKDHVYRWELVTKDLRKRARADLRVLRLLILNRSLILY